MSDSHPASDPDPAVGEAVENLLVRALELLEQGGAPAVDRLLAAHPALAARVRAHLVRLDRIGLTREAPDA